MYRTGQLGKGWPMTDTVQTRYRVTGMDCGSCAAKVDAAVRRLPGVADVSVSATAGIMMVHHAPEDTLLPALKANLKGLGYDVSPADDEPIITMAQARAIQHALEAVGAEFTNGDQPGIRLARKAPATG